MKPKVYIDGKDGTTGLQIYDRLAARDDIDLLLISEDKRKDPVERKKLMAAADIVFLCLPDGAAMEAVALAEGTKARIIDASTGKIPAWTRGATMEIKPVAWQPGLATYFACAMDSRWPFRSSGKP